MRSFRAPRFAHRQLRDRLRTESDVTVTQTTPAPSPLPSYDSYSFHLKTYGCQMNVSDSEIVRSIMLTSTFPRFHEVQAEEEADISLTNTCAIRDGAERKVWNRAYQVRGLRLVSESFFVGRLWDTSTGSNSIFYR